jgi:hypothetical protein
MAILRFREFEKRVLRKIFGGKRDRKLTGKRDKKT